MLLPEMVERIIEMKEKDIDFYRTEISKYTEQIEDATFLRRVYISCREYMKEYGHNLTMNQESNMEHAAAEQ